jgi:plasmid stabilization system protein ParE
VRRATFLASVERDLVDIFTHIAQASGSLSIARRYVNGRFEVVNILHGHRDVETFFTAEP